MSCITYILDSDGNPVPEPDVKKWGLWMKANGRRVAKTDVEGTLVSTVFLGTDHNTFGGEPLLFETMVFESSDFMHSYVERYSNRQQAIAGHDQAVAMVRDAIRSNGGLDKDN